MTDNPCDNEVVLTVRVADGQYHVDTGIEHDDPWPASDDGLSTGEHGWIGVISGVDWGTLALVVQILQGHHLIPRHRGTW